MHFFVFEDYSICKYCATWSRHTYDNDGMDVGKCTKRNSLTLESYNCSPIYEFLKEIGFNHTTKCSLCDFRSADELDEICKAKVRLKQGGSRILDEEFCPIRLIYKYIKQEEIL